MKVSLGIDPGSKGAIAIFSEAGALVAIHDMPVIKMKVGKTMRERVSPHGIFDLLWPMDIQTATVEKVGGMTGQSASAAYTFGYSCGVIEGVLIGLRVATTFVTPQSWKKSFGLAADKGNARQCAMRLWPEKSALFARVKDDGRAESALIGRFGMQQK